MEKNYILEYEGQKFGTSPNPPKLIRLGSGEILQWRNTLHPKIPMSAAPIAVYKNAEIKDYSFMFKEKVSV